MPKNAREGNTLRQLKNYLLYCATHAYTANVPKSYQIVLLFDLLCTSHKTGKHSEAHLGVGLHEVFGEGVDSCSNLT